MSATPDHYATLEITRFSDQADIRAAYRKLAAQYHPDKNSDPAASDKFIAITEAYNALEDPNAKATYDALLRSQALKAAAAKRLIPDAPRSTFAPTPVNQVNRIQRDAQMNLKLQPDLVRLTRLLSQSKFNDAERLAHQILAEDATQPVPYAVLGDIHRFRGELKKSAEMYSYASQMAPENDLYIRKHEETLVALEKAQKLNVTTATPEAVVHQRANRLGVGIAICFLAIAYMFVAKENPIFLNVPMISTWTLGLIGMLTISGVAMGASMAISDHLETFTSTHQGGAARLSPSAILAALALLNFWLAAIVFAVIGLTQNAINRSVARAIGCAAVLVLVFTIVCAAGSSGIRETQVLLWGGNLVYLGTLCGWMMSDSFRR
jgi:hypothetical protein